MLLDEVKTDHEDIEIDGTPVKVEQKADTLTVTIPEGLSEEQKAKIKADIEHGRTSKLSAHYYQKLHAMNQEREEWEKELEAAKTKPETQSKEPESAEKSIATKPLWEHLGVKSEEELNDLAAENPSLFIRKTAEYNAAVMEEKIKARENVTLRQIKEELMKNELEMKIKQLGLDPAKVQAYANYLGAPVTDRLIQTFQSVTKDKSNPVFQAQMDAQAKNVNIVEATHHRLPTSPKEEDLEKLTPEELETYIDTECERVLG